MFDFTISGNTPKVTEDLNVLKAFFPITECGNSEVLLCNAAASQLLMMSLARPFQRIPRPLR